MIRSTRVYYGLLMFFVGVILSLAISLFCLGPTLSKPPASYFEMASGIVTAFIAVLAAFINLWHLRDKRQSRIWEVNKQVVLDLLKCLHNEMKSLDIEIHNVQEELIRNSAQPGEPEYAPRLKRQIEFNPQETSDVLEKFKSRHSPFLSRSLNKAIEAYELENKKISADIDDGMYGCYDFEPYERAQAVSSHLANEILKFCEKISGVQVIYPS